jgi:Sigma-70 region 2
VHRRFCVNRRSGPVAPDFRVKIWALCIDPPFAKLIRGSWFAKVVVMSERSTEQIRELLDSLYRVDSGRILATLIRLLGDFDLAEEAMHEAFAVALDTWPQAGVPDKPRPWLISTARFKAIDGMRRRARFDGAQKDLALYLEARINEAPHEDEEIEDDRLRLIFTCCHPSLAAHCPRKGKDSRDSDSVRGAGAAGIAGATGRGASGDLSRLQ